MGDMLVRFPLILFVIQLAWAENAKYVCDASDFVGGKDAIYCHGRILEAVNKLGLYKDSKDFVDSTLKKPPYETNADFKTLFPDDNSITRQKLQKFVDEHFNKPESELDVCTPEDWLQHPPKFSLITDPEYNKFAHNLNDIWKQLCRKMNSFVEKNSSMHSLLYVPRPFIAPGGRFREFYYWDSYWIVKGLLASSMYQSAANMIHNLAYMVEHYGFVPNGGRIYYLRRSQPPMLTPMVYENYRATRNVTFVRTILPTLIKELDFWRKNRQIKIERNGVTYTLYQYRSDINTPRPESWKEDYKTAGNKSKSSIFPHIQAACESGWDFSSRWLTEDTKLETIHTNEIVPVDLNAIICWNLDILSLLYKLTNNLSASQKLDKERNELKSGLLNVLYNHTERAWFDWNMASGQHNVKFYPSVAVPLFTGCYNLLDTFKPEDLYMYLNRTGALKFAGGIPTSLIRTKEQWDFPNGWPPLNHMIIEGLRKSRNGLMQRDAWRLAERWVQNNYVTYKNFRRGNWPCPCMFEKYNVLEQGMGQGGEYNPQTGFGWTNGVVLDLMVTYGDWLHAPSSGVADHMVATLAVTIAVLLSVIS